MSHPFDPREPANSVRLIADYPLGWLVSRQFNASPLPLIAETREGGSVAALFCHCELGQPLVADFRANPLGLILLNGPAAIPRRRSSPSPTGRRHGIMRCCATGSRSSLPAMKRLMQTTGWSSRWRVAIRSPRFAL